MLLQTNSYVVPKDKRTEHARLMQRFRQAMLRLGCEMFEVYEQTAANWAGAESAGRFIQMMRFKDRKHQQAVQAAERNDPVAQQLIREFCDLINFPYQQQQGLFATGYYSCVVSTLAASPVAVLVAPDQPGNDPYAQPVPQDIPPLGVQDDSGNGDITAADTAVGIDALDDEPTLDDLELELDNPDDRQNRDDESKPLSNF